MNLGPAHHIVTPLIASPANSTNPPFYLKLDNLQPPGSYKIRGMSLKARRAIKERGAKRFVASSGGNAGLAVAYTACRMKIPCRVFVPSTTPESARSLIESYGAVCVVEGDLYAEADACARAEGEEEGTEYFSAYDDNELWEGHASIVEEIKEQVRASSRSKEAYL